MSLRTGNPPARPLSPFRSPPRKEGRQNSTPFLNSSVWSASPVKSSLLESTIKSGNIERLVPREKLQLLASHLQNRSGELSREYREDLKKLQSAIESYNMHGFKTLNFSTAHPSRLAGWPSPSNL